MATLETLTAQLASLDAAIASGVLIVRHGDTMTTFQSLDSLLKARAFVQQQIDKLAGTARTRIRYAYQAGKGL